MSYIYLKNEPEVKPPVIVIKGRLRQHKKPIAVALFSFGIFLFAFAVFPIVQYQFEYSTKFGQIVNPLSAKYYNQTGSVLGELSTDYTQLNNWFTSSPSTEVKSTIADATINTYTLSIPKLKIKDAVVIVGSQDLKKSLIQYPQTSLPGQLGNGVVFGHSVLPQFFNPKSYLTIFATLYRLKEGDEIDVTYDNISYKYLVSEMYEVQPTDLSILEQRYDGKYLSLVTCSPPGTYLRRLVIRAQIADY